ncbi:MAG: succinylglutamate desuccinylase/aspartoacylase family protein [Verrucomicrobiales bacterium]
MEKADPSSSRKPRRVKPTVAPPAHVPRSVLRIGDREFLPGESGKVEIKIGSLIDYQPVTMTVHVHRGKQPGPRILLSAALHGDEIVGVEIVRSFLRSRLLSRLHGDVVAVPVVNLPAFLARSRYLPDRRDLNRVFPGSTNGSLGSRLASVYLQEVVAKCTHIIDFHAGSVNQPNLPQIRFSPGDTAALAMARAFRAPVAIETTIRAGSFRESAYRKGIPYLLYEAGEAHRVDQADIRCGLQGITGVMRHLGMFPEEVRHPRKGKAKVKGKRPETFISPSTSWLRAPRGGIFRPFVDLGEAVTKGMVAGIVADPFGQHETDIIARTEGIVIGISRKAAVDEGDGTFHVAQTTHAVTVQESIQENRSLIDAEEAADTAAW